MSMVYQPLVSDEVTVTLVVAKTITLTGKALAGVPAPNMYLAIYVDDALLKDTTYTSVTLNQPYTLTAQYDKPGDHKAYGKMVLSNPLGSKEYVTDVISFTV
jgi:hypothetical protein